ncbi:hypothetical protein DAPPUDRAFT_301872 [Daphnia pulex]|uniref:Peptidase S8 pro-domain domain-containing protein n=1 Tax=Daphnia pulex TaxID=6669 RepID=E9GAY3_DAPPU|nr:hypothetical protein DAPPUDRAFT_301872 [Daphnia pulex]|eukprot:EFX83340.1 hypothetical protein DAPPUDRAFT_301872 [Daphnia pulex]
MKKFQIFTALLFCSVLHSSYLFPLPGPSPQGMWSDVNSQCHTEEDAFMIAKDVTQEEIEEFHRSNGFVPADLTENLDTDGQDRSFGKNGESLKFWNWPAFHSFRHWIEERRTTTIKPIPVYIVNNPDDSYSFN